MSEVKAAQEEWLPIPGYGGDYEVSSLGNIRSWKRRGYNGSAGCKKRSKSPIKIKLLTTMHGYLYVNLRNVSTRKIAKVHRLVLEAFKPSSDNSRWMANHIDGNKKNNRVENLEWVTPSENILHAREKIGRGPIKLTKEKVLEMRRLYQSGGITQKEISVRFGICWNNAKKILRGEYWAWVK